jgi:hypothetical protein
MKTLRFLLFPAIALLFSCGLKDEYAHPSHQPLASDLVHFDIYIELLPDPELNQDEQCQQAYSLRLMSRAGYRITFYRVLGGERGESVIREGLSNTVGNYKVLDMPMGTYRIVVEDHYGGIRESTLTPSGGKLTKLTFGFAIPG